MFLLDNFIFSPLSLIPYIQRLLSRDATTSSLTLSISLSDFLICWESRRKQDASRSSSDAHAAAAAHAAYFGRLCGSLGGQDRGCARRRALCQQHGHEDPSLARGPGVGELFGSQLDLVEHLVLLRSLLGPTLGSRFSFKSAITQVELNRAPHPKKKT